MIPLYFPQNRAETFFLQIGQFGYQTTQNFMLVPNPKKKVIKMHPKVSKNLFIQITFH